MSGDFKVIGINDEGTEVRFGGDDLDKINRILNGEDLELDILIDNEWSFNSNKLVIRDSSGGDNKIHIASSAEVADWIITIPTLGGNREPLFTDLDQEITNKNIDGAENTFTNIPDSAIVELDWSKLSGTPVKLDDLSAPDDNTDLDVSISAHGLVPKAPNETSQFLDGTGNWSILPYATTTSRGAVTLADDGEAVATLVVEATDSRLSDTRDPNAHAVSHGDGQSDEIEIDWSQITSGIPAEFTPSDHATEHITGGGDIIPVATITSIGLLPILSNDNTEFLDGQGNWSVPSLGSISIDALNDVDTSTVAPSNNDVLTWNSTDAEWVPAEPPGASGGEANTAANVGTGEGDVFRDKTSTTINLRTLVAGNNISISTGTDEVTIDGTHNHDADYADINHNHDADYADIDHDHSAADITSGTLGVTRGGTGKVTITEDALLVGGATNTIDEIAVGTEDHVLAVVSGTPAWKSLNSELTGTAEADGNNSSVEFVVPHDLGSIPYSHFIQCYSHSIPFSWTIDANDFTVTFDEAPETGTDNVKFSWRVIE